MGKNKTDVELCCDPLHFGSKVHRKTKTRKGIAGVSAISANLFTRVREFLPHASIERDSKLCVTCRLTLSAEIKKIENRLAALTESSQAHDDTVESVHVQPDFALYPALPTDTVPGPSAPPEEPLAKKITLMRDLYPEIAIAEGYLPPPSFTATTAFSAEGGTVVQAIDVNEQLKGLLITPVRPGDKRQPRRLESKVHEITKTAKEVLSKFKGAAVGSPKRECLYCEQLKTELAVKFQGLNIKKEKYLCLTSVPRRFGETIILKDFHCSVYEARQACNLRKRDGHFSYPIMHYMPKTIDEDTQELVRNFYMNIDNSRPSPSLRDTIIIKNPITGEKLPHAKHYILHSLDDLYKLFQQDHPNNKISRSKFAMLRPKFCKFPGAKGRHNVCVCEIHENFKLLMDCVGAHLTSSELADLMLCQNKTSDCYLGFCDDCPKMAKIDEILENIDDDEDVMFLSWTGTDRTALTQCSESGESFKQRFKNYLPKLMAHHHINERQKNYFQYVKDELLPLLTFVLVQVDYGQNYEFIIQNAVQGFHWNNQQCTVHPFVVYFYCTKKNQINYKTYFAISDSLDHDAENFHALRSDFIALLKHDLLEWGLNVQKVIYQSDGAASQYKNHKNFTNMQLHLRDFRFASEWHFSATSHGKGTCDAMTAVVKRAARLESLRKDGHILNADELFAFCQRKLASEKLQFFYVSKARVQEINAPLQERYQLSKTIPGTRSFHSFVPTSQNSMSLKLYSAQIDFINHIIGHIDPPPTDVFPERFIAVKVDAKWQVGQILLVDYETLDLEISYMKRVGRGNKLRWPPAPVTGILPFSFVLCNIEPPSPVTADGQQFVLTLADYNMVTSKMRSP